VTLGYNFGNLIGDGFGLRVYATAQNLVTFTNYSGVDPENSGGIDNAPFPRARTFTLGARIGL
jgi:iron complex outermembrane receptor protein